MEMNKAEGNWVEVQQSTGRKDEWRYLALWYLSTRI